MHCVLLKLSKGLYHNFDPVMCVRACVCVVCICVCVVCACCARACVWGAGVTGSQGRHHDEITIIITRSLTLMEFDVTIFELKLNLAGI